MARKKKIQGLGDAVVGVTEATGIKAIVHAIAGDDCGCEERKEKLNKLFCWGRIVVNCINDEDKDYMRVFIESKSNQLRYAQQREMSEIYFRVYNKRIEPTSCGSCWRDYVNQLKEVYENS